MKGKEPIRHKAASLLMVLSLAIMVVGLFLILGPTLSGYYYDWEMEKAADNFCISQGDITQDDKVQSDNAGLMPGVPMYGGVSKPTVEEGAGFGATAQKTLTSHENDNHENQLLAANMQEDQLANADTELREQIRIYNESLAREKQVGMTDIEALEDAPFIMEDYGKTEQIGSIEIPAMKIALPIYQGAREENFLKGAAWCAQTSFPVGGPDTNCVIAAHRGYRGSAYFRDIEQLKIGDIVKLRNYWEEMIYQVVKIALIYPYEVNAITIKPGHDLLTLMTCHPYIGHTKRYLVYCERVEMVSDEELAAFNRDAADNVGTEFTNHKVLGQEPMGTDISGNENLEFSWEYSGEEDFGIENRSDAEEVLETSSEKQILLDRIYPWLASLGILVIGCGSYFLHKIARKKA